MIGNHALVYEYKERQHAMKFSEHKRLAQATTSSIIALVAASDAKAKATFWMVNPKGLPNKRKQRGQRHCGARPTSLVR